MKNIFKPAFDERVEESQNDQPDTLPVLPLKDAILLPGGILPLIVTNPASISLVKELHSTGSAVAAVGMKRHREIHPSWESLYRTGCMALITKISTLKPSEVSIMIRGIHKIILEEPISDHPSMRARVTYLGENLEPDKEVYALALSCRDVLGQLARLSYQSLETVLSNLSKIKDPLTLLSATTTNLPFPVEKKQRILEENDIHEKYSLLHTALREELEILELSSKITEKAKGEINNAQREYYLRQQLKTIKKELGEGATDLDDEIEELKKEIDAKQLPEDVKTEVEKDLKRISRMQPASSEYVTIRTYLDWILDLPWHETTPDNLEIPLVENILDEDHFNLKKPKKRIIEFLSVKKLKSELKGPILCFVGPPGVGKTSLGRSIARAMGRKFIRISLGGVRDEAEIRGHRRTYIGSMPGRIINGIKLAGTINPVFMLDEIDKLTHDIHGDPASALLEALDPEQNNHFVDHYLNVPFDLSKVFFITTANVIDTIPAALKDRLEIVEIEGYTQEDKLQIAKNYLIPKEVDSNGLNDIRIELPDSSIEHIIHYYTRESGVRNLQREIASCLRVIASEVARCGGRDFCIDNDFVEKALGPLRYLPETMQRTRIPGIATGLAWTPFGGEILFVESAMVEGKDEMILTGQMGEVMKESARLALSIIKGMGHPIEKDHCMHIHVPAGAIPKDGPSAGVTIVTSIISLLTGKVVRDDLAMTGEITLRGVVLPVGGIKEKVLAARRAGITTVLLPKMNEKDLADIEGSVTKDLTIHLVENIEEILKFAFAETDSRDSEPLSHHREPEDQGIKPSVRV
ncbi:MAG: endopeptidase La [Desulfomonilia bacterium]